MQPDFPASATEINGFMANIRLRPAVREDMGFLRELYGHLRASDMDQAGWPEATRETFLDSQFALQHRHFVTHYPSADFWVVEANNMPIGRYYLQRERPYFLIIDIALLPTWRRLGMGAALLAWTKAQAQQQHAAGVQLHVDERNLAAQRLYAREGFTETSRSSPYIAMHWPYMASDQLNTA